MGLEPGSGGNLGELGGIVANFISGESPAAVKSRVFFVSLVELVSKDEKARAQFIEAVTALKDTSDEVWKDVPHMQRLALSATLKTVLGALT